MSIDEKERQEVTSLPLETFTGWLAGGERGMSSEAIVAHLTGHPVGRYGSRDYPHDPDDFRRCQRLLRVVPLAGLWFPTMRSCSPVWARLVDAWDEIHATIEAEVPGYVDSHPSGSAPKGYRLMRRVIDGGTECATCEGSGQAAACPRCKGTGKRSGGRCRYPGCSSGYFACGPCRGKGYTTLVAYQKGPK